MYSVNLARYETHLVGERMMNYIIHLDSDNCYDIVIYLGSIGQY